MRCDVASVSPRMSVRLLVVSEYRSLTLVSAAKLASFLGFPRFFFVVVLLWFAFSIIQGSGRAQKTGKALEHLSRE